MKILVLNCGSSSLKYQLFDMETETVLAKGLCERIGLDGSLLSHAGRGEYKTQTPMKDHADAIELVTAALSDKNYGVINDIHEIKAVGHRVVHGGEAFTGSVIIDESVKNAINECAEIAPLHNPPNLTGILACERLMGHIPQIAVFDTAFHQSMPKRAYLYALPYEYYENLKVRKYGFHGTSHKYVSQRAAALLNRPLDELKIITCHLGNGSSVCAVLNGRSVDTSMGFTPLEGLCMGTRSGDLDPAVVSYLCEKEGLTAKEAENVLNKKSGVLGISGVSSDFRDIEKAADGGNERAKAALEIFYYRVAKYIGSYAAALNGADAVVFTAGLGENSSAARKAVCAYLGFLGLTVDDAKNAQRGVETFISTDGSATAALVIPTNEELMIAREARGLL